ncbi:MAG: cupin domain-containing protein [Acidimicrobiia bacterium]
MRFHTFDELAEYTPGGHEGVVNRLLVGRENLDVGGVSVWHGILEPGGRSELHSHPQSLQIYVGIAGEMVVGDGERDETLDRLATAVFEAGSDHFIENRTDRAAEVLVISVPGLR